VRIVVDEAGEVSEMLVEALVQRAVSDFGSEMPFAEEGSFVAGLLQDLGEGDFRRIHVAQVGVTPIAVPLQPALDSASIGMSSRE